MPTYEYECDGCGHQWELFQKFTAKPVKKCPKCAKPKARRLLSSGSGMLFKGTGFHTTDYRSASYKKAAAADSGAHAPKDKPAKIETAKKIESAKK